MERFLELHECETPRFPNYRHLSLARFSGPDNRRIYPPPPGDIPGSHFCYRPEVLSQIEIPWTPYENGHKP